MWEWDYRQLVPNLKLFAMHTILDCRYDFQSLKNLSAYEAYCIAGFRDVTYCRMTALCIPGCACSFSALLASSYESIWIREPATFATWQVHIVSWNRGFSLFSMLVMASCIDTAAAAAAAAATQRPPKLGLLILCVCPSSHTAHKRYFKHRTHVIHTHSVALECPVEHTYIQLAINRRDRGPDIPAFQVDAFPRKLLQDYFFPIHSISLKSMNSKLNKKFQLQSSAFWQMSS